MDRQRQGFENYNLKARKGLWVLLDSPPTGHNPSEDHAGGETAFRPEPPLQPRGFPAGDSR